MSTDRTRTTRTNCHNKKCTWNFRCVWAENENRRYFDSYAIFKTAYENASFQIFKVKTSNTLKPTISKSPSKTANSIKQYQSAVKAQVVYVRAQGEPRRLRGTGVRETTHTRKIGCPVTFTISGSKLDRMIRVVKTADSTKHNHEMSKENFEHERENRLLDGEEKQEATELEKPEISSSWYGMHSIQVIDWNPTWAGLLDRTGLRCTAAVESWEK